MIMKKMIAACCCICMIFGSVTAVSAGEDRIGQVTASDASAEETVMPDAEENSSAKASADNEAEPVAEYSMTEVDEAEAVSENDALQTINDEMSSASDLTDASIENTDTVEAIGEDGSGEEAVSEETAESEGERTSDAEAESDPADAGGTETDPAEEASEEVYPLKSAALSVAAVVYNGKARTPAATVLADVNGKEVTLTEGTDYTVAYANNTNAGTATVTVTGTGSYSGTLEASFEIKPKTIAQSKVEIKNGVTSYGYKGRALKPGVIVTSSVTGKTLKNGTDYKVSYKNNTNVGTATIIVTGQGNYKSSAKTTFTITPTTIAKSTVEIKNGVTSFGYKGRALKPGVIVTSSVTGKTLKNGKDYTVSYRKNVNVGTATVIVTGQGNYKSSAKTTFTITPTTIAKSKVEIKNGVTSFGYKGRALKPSVVVTSSVTGKTLKKGTDYTVSYKNNTNAGTATIIVRGQGNYKSTLKTTFTITPRRLTKNMFYPCSAVYTGKPLKPALDPYFSYDLKKDVDYTAAYYNNINTYQGYYVNQGELKCLFRSQEGKPQPYVLLKGKGNYKGTLKLPFSIYARFLPYAAGHTDPGAMGQMTAKVGDSFQLRLNYLNSDGRIVDPEGGIWRVEAPAEELKESYDTSSVTVSETGWLTAVKSGTAYVSYTKDNKEVGYVCVYVAE